MELNFAQWSQDRVPDSHVTDEQREQEGDQEETPPRSPRTLLALLRWFSDD